MDMEERRIVIIGSTGNGKSATANTILGQKVFESKASNHSVTKKCQFGERNLKGKRLILVDTPAMFNTNMSEEESFREMAKVIGLTSPGVHAVIVVVKVGRFTEQERKSFEKVRRLFGFQIFERLIILFTGVDNLDADGYTFQEYVKHHIKPELKNLVLNCGNRAIGFNNRASERERDDHVEALLRMIESIMQKNQNTYYNDTIYDMAADMFEEEENKRGNAESWKSKEDLQREIRRAIEKEDGVEEFLNNLIEQLQYADAKPDPRHRDEEKGLSEINEWSLDCLRRHCTII